MNLFTYDIKKWEKFEVIPYKILSVSFTSTHIRMFTSTHAYVNALFEQMGQSASSLTFNIPSIVPWSTS